MSESHSVPGTPELVKTFLQEAPVMFEEGLDSNARRQILTNCYRALWSNDPEWMRTYFFKDSIGNEESISQQLEKYNLLGEPDDNASATPVQESFRPGTQCGHLFKRGESVYRCRNCGHDETCVMCSRCFHASKHEGHDVKIFISKGAGGCCDCGDVEAWKIPLECSLHTPAKDASVSQGDAMDILESMESVPQALLDSIKATIEIILDYILETFAISPEEKAPTTAEDIIRDRDLSHRVLGMPSIEGRPQTYACVLWNDEKHTFDQVIRVVRRATLRAKLFAKKVAETVDSIGRYTLETSDDIDQLLRISTIISEETLAMSIRSVQDTIREDICGLLIGWLKVLVSGKCRFFSHIQDGDRIIHDAIFKALCAEWSLRPELATLSMHNRRERRLNAADDMFSFEDDDGDSFSDDVDEDGDTPLLGLRPITMRDILLATAEDDIIMEASDDEQDEADDEDGDDDDDDDDDNDGDDDIHNNSLHWDTYHDASSDVDMAQDELHQLDTSNQAPVDTEPRSSVNSEPRRRSSTSSSHTQFRQRKDIADPNGEFNTWLAHIGNVEAEEFALAESIGLAVTSPRSATTETDHVAKKEFKRKTRLDYLLHFDLRLWKRARSDVKDLLIGTFVSNSQYRPVLGIRYVRNYPELIEAFFFKDREPEQSIITLSVQLLTVPTVAGALVRDYRFFDIGCSILANFFLLDDIRMLPPKEYQHAQIDCSSQAIQRHRYACTFYDLRYVLNSEQVKQTVAANPLYIRQFVDMLYQFQEMNPLLRKVGTHVEFESAEWVNAFNVTLQISKVCHPFTQCYEASPSLDASRNVCRAIFRLIKAIIDWSPSNVQVRSQSSTSSRPLIHGIHDFHFHVVTTPHAGSFDVVTYDVAKDLVSFHHPFHWVLSGLFKHVSLLSDHWVSQVNPTGDGLVFMIQHIFQDEPDVFLKLLEYPLRTIVLIAQVSCGLWVRNGYSVQNQARTYRDMSVRENTYDEDVYLLQIAFLMMNADKLLVTILDRFNVMAWFLGKPDKKHSDYDATQLTFIIEELLQLLIICATERGYISGMSIENQIRRSIIQYLGISSMAFSELLELIPESLRQHESMDQYLAELANYRPPDGLNDSGLYELKEEFIPDIDPYFWHYTRNQREEAYKALRKHAKRQHPEKWQGENDEFFIVPQPKEIVNAPFKYVDNFLQSRVMCQIIVHAIWNVKISQKAKSDAILDEALHLALLAAVGEQETTSAGKGSSSESRGFIYYATHDEYAIQINELERIPMTLLNMLLHCLNDNVFPSARMRILYLVDRIEKYATGSVKQEISEWRLSKPAAEASAASGRASSHAHAEYERKKAASKARQEAIMSQFAQAQSNFLSQHGDFYDADEDLEDELENEMDAMPVYGDQAEIERISHFPAGTCIVCQEELDRSRLYGVLALVQQSNMCRTMPMEHDVIERVLETGLDDDRDAGLKHFPHDHQLPGLHVSSCGHLMHMHCFDNYHTLTRVLQRDRFLCPLCKALGNVLLPIVWKGKRESYPGVVAPTSDYANVGDVANKLKQELSHFKISHASQSVQPPAKRTYISHVDMKEAVEHTPDGLQIPYITLMSLVMDGEHTELTLANCRKAITELVDMYTYTIEAVEIAQRGAPLRTTDVTIEHTHTYLDSIASQHQRLLKVLAMTNELFPHVMTGHRLPEVIGPILSDVLDTIFSSHGRSILMEDPLRVLCLFGYCSVSMPGKTHVEIHHVLRITYLAALTKTIVGLVQGLVGNPHAIEGCDDILQKFQANGGSTSNAFVGIVQSNKQNQRGTTVRTQEDLASGGADQLTLYVMTLLGVPTTTTEALIHRVGANGWATLIRTCTRPFLRQSLLLMVAHHGYVVQPQMTNEHEYDAILSSLRLPTWTDVWQLAPHEQTLVAGWCQQLSQPCPTIPLPLPTVYHLIELPHRMEELIDASLHYVCPQCRGVPDRPALCLICGQFVCARQLCCAVDHHGECNKHMQKCGAEVGLYLVVKDCFVLLLHENGGTIMSAPYLDAHGEADMYLKRGAPQYLNTKRYEQLRAMWLSHTIPSFVRRRMETVTQAHIDWESW